MNKKRENIKWVYSHVQDEKVILIHKFENEMAVCVNVWDTENYINGHDDYSCSVWSKQNWEHIKEPTYRPYQELTEELAENLIGSLIKNKHFFRLNVIIACQVKPDHIILNDETLNLEDLFEEYTFLDGSPIGEEVRED